MKIKYKYFEKLDGWKRMSWWEKSLSLGFSTVFPRYPRFFNIRGFRKAPHKNKLQEENKNDT